MISYMALNKAKLMEQITPDKAGIQINNKQAVLRNGQVVNLTHKRSKTNRKGSNLLSTFQRLTPKEAAK